jgi:hypothetical protein
MSFVFFVLLHNSKMLKARLNYIHENPMRAGIVEEINIIYIALQTIIVV